MSHLIGSISPSFLISQKFLCFGSLSSRHLECVQWTNKTKGRHQFFSSSMFNSLSKMIFMETVLFILSLNQYLATSGFPGGQMVKNLPAMLETWV